MNADQAANLAGKDNVVVLNGIHLFRIAAAASAQFPGPARLWIGQVIYRDCASMAAACAHHDQMLDRHRLRGGMNSELPSAFGFVTNPDNEAFAYISPNGKVWRLTYLGPKGGVLSARPFFMSL